MYFGLRVKNYTPRAVFSFFKYKKCTAFFSVSSRYTTKPCCVLQLLQLYSKNVLPSSTFLFILQEHVPRSLCTLEVHQKSVPRSSVYPRGTPKIRSAFFKQLICTPRTCSAFFNYLICTPRTCTSVSQLINLYSKNVYSVIQLVNLHFKNVFCVLQRTSKYMV